MLVPGPQFKEKRVRLVLLKLDRASELPRGPVKDCWEHPQSFRFSRSAVGPENVPF